MAIILIVIWTVKQIETKTYIYTILYFIYVYTQIQYANTLSTVIVQVFFHNGTKSKEVICVQNPNSLFRLSIQFRLGLWL